MPALDCKYAMFQLVNAVQAVHAAGLLHRDIKPDNVLVACLPGKPHCHTYKLCDFGTAVPEFDTRQQLRNEGKEGTPAFLPPEAFWQRTSDTWQVGKCLLALRSGAAPHRGSFVEVQASGLYDNLPDPMQESEWAFLKQCLEPNSGSRPDPVGLLKAGVYPSVL
jgi:serine/threonine protein kinase